MQLLKPLTSDDYSPHDQLPACEPKECDYPDGYFYHNTAKHLIKDTVRIMANGLHVDLNKVSHLEKVLEKEIQNVKQVLSENRYIQEFQQLQYKKQVKDYIKDRKSKMRSESYYLKDFNPKDMTHRSYFMDLFAKENGVGLPQDKLPTGVSKWPVKHIRKLSGSYPILKRLLDNQLTKHKLIDEAMYKLASDKVKMYNEKYLQQIHHPDLEIPEFNPNSANQKQELFAWLDIPCEAFSKKTGLPSWNKDQIDRANKETTDPLVQEITKAFLDFSAAAIIRNNFIKAFYNYTVDNRLHGQYNLLGAKSGRYTSNNPNMLNMPSTGSVFAKPIKKCFTAPKGYVIGAIDYSALEDRVVANLSRDENKLGLFLEGLDGHSLSATYYYPDRVRELIGEFSNNKEASRKLKAIVDDLDHPKHKEAKSVRQDSKPISFGLAYGAYPPKVAATVKIPIEDAELIFNAYHNDLFPSITDFRENYVLPTAKQEGQIHLGLGFNLLTDDPDKDIRTLNNACSQFWSILTALTINKIHQLIDKEGLQDDIKVTSTIYDSIYFEIKDDPKIIKWLNDHLIPIMETDFMEDQIVHNSADLEIGPDWATLHQLPHNASVEEVTEVRSKFHNIYE